MKLKTLNKRSGAFVYRSSQPSANVNSVVTTLNNLSSDIEDIYNEYNQKIRPAFYSLARGTEDSIIGLTEDFDAIRNGIDGLSIFTDRNSTNTSSEWIFSTILNRPLTIKESLAEIYQSLTEQIDSINSTTGGTTFTTGALLFGDGTKTPSNDSDNLYWDIDNLRLGICTNTPTSELEVNGVITISGGLVSTGGNTRGLYAIDLQYNRTADTQIASGDYSFIQGQYNTVSGIGSVAIGSSNTITSNGSYCFGIGNTTSKNDTTLIGSRGKAINVGQRVFASGYFANAGDAQVSFYTLRNTTSSNVVNQLFTDGTSEVISLEDNKTYLVTVEVVGSNTSGISCGYKLEGLIKRGANAAATSISGSIIKTIINEEDALLDADLTVDTGTGSIKVNVTGLAGTDIHWVAFVRVVETTINN